MNEHTAGPLQMAAESNGALLITDLVFIFLS